jgi:hypothetical protein
MDTRTRNSWILIFGLGVSSPAFAGPNEVVVDGIEVRLGMMTAERLRAYPRGSVEAAMHGGVPKGSGYYHVNVTLFDAATHAAIADASVEAELIQAGAAPVRKHLVAMTINRGQCYGEYFRLAGREPPSIVVRIASRGTTHVTEAKFRPQPD